MKPAVLDPKKVTVQPKQLVAVAAGMLGLGGMPNPDDPMPSGPWDPVIRAVLGATPYPWRVTGLLDPEPSPWQAGVAGLAGAVFGPDPTPWKLGAAALARVGLNPQPLPPRVAMVATLAEAAIARAELLGDMAQGERRQGAGAYVMMLIDDWCGTPPRKFPWPWPGPRPHWAEEVIGPVDHLVMAAVFEAVLKGPVGEDLGRGMRGGMDRLLESAAMPAQ
jgi:hypothetical protein